MNILNCCRICLEETSFTTFNLSEYIGNSSIRSLIEDICQNVNVNKSIQEIKFYILIHHHFDSFSFLVGSKTTFDLQRLPNGLENSV
jgi:hypothetical protein